MASALRNPRALRCALTLTALSALCVGVTACGGGDPLASLTAKQIMDKATSNLTSQNTFHVVGSVQDSGETISLDFAFDRGKGCQGTLGISGKGTVDLVVIGSNAYMKFSDAFWKAIAGSDASMITSKLQGKYIEAPTSNSNVSQISSFCDVSTIASSFTTTDTVAKGAKTTFNGQSVVSLKDTKDGGVMLVTDASSPQILQVTGSKSGNGGKVVFSGYGQPVTLTTPPSSQIVSGSQFGF